MDIFSKFELVNTLFKNAKSQKELAQRLGTTPRTLQKWAKAGKVPQAKQQAVNKLYQGYSPTIKNTDKQEKFQQQRKTTKQRTKQIEKVQKKKQPPAPTEQILPIAEWIKLYLPEEYRTLPDYGLLNDMIYSRGLKYAKFMSNIPTEAIFLRSPNENWGDNPFAQMIGITEGYPYDENSRQLFLRRSPREIVALIGQSTERILAQARNLFFQRGKGTEGNENDIKMFTAIYFEDFQEQRTKTFKQPKSNKWIEAIKKNRAEK